MKNPTKADPKLLYFMADKWNEGLSVGSIADAIMNIYGKTVFDQQIYDTVKKYPNLFNKRTKSESAQIAAGTLELNRRLRKKNKQTITEYLASKSASCSMV